MIAIGSHSWQQQASIFAFEGHAIAQHRAGQGPALLLIHGFPTSSYDWASMWPQLATHYSLYAIDMLGFGLSDKPKNYAYSIKASADQWQSYVQANGLLEVSILCHDYGNTVAQELLARQREGALPFRIIAVTFLNGGLFPEATFPILMQKLLRSRLGPVIARLSSYSSFARSMRKICTCLPSEDELRAHWQLLIRAGGKSILPKIIQYIGERRVYRARWCEALQHADIPLRAIIGVDDPISGLSIAKRWRELLPGSPCLELPGVGHYPQWENPEKLFEVFKTGFY